MNPVSFSNPRFGGFGDSTPLGEKAKTTASLMEEYQLQDAISKMPVEDLVYQLAMLKGSNAAFKKDKSRAVVPDVIEMPVSGQLMRVYSGDVPGLLGINSDDLQGMFQENLDGQREEINASTQKRIDLIIEELRSRVLRAEILDREKVPYTPSDTGKDKPGIEVDTLKRFLDRTA